VASAIIVDCEQRTPAWFKARAGVLTATGAADMLAKALKSGGEPASRRDLRTRLVVERLTGEPAEENGYVSPEMKRGTELEPLALAAYEAATGLLVQSVGFIKHEFLPVGCSPDGVIGELEGGVELKAPKSATHLGYLRHPGKCPTEYVPQLTHTLFVTDAPWWDFCSFDPRFPEPLQLFRVRVFASDLNLTAYAELVDAFLAEVAAEFDEVAALLAAAVTV
jgi:hypothetical protein